MIFFRKKEKLLTMEQVVYSLENNIIYAKKLSPTFNEHVRARIQKQHGISIEELIIRLEKSVSSARSLLDHYPDLEQRMPNNTRKALTKEIRNLNRDLIVILRDIGYEM